MPKNIRSAPLTYRSNAAFKANPQEKIRNAKPQENKSKIGETQPAAKSEEAADNSLATGLLQQGQMGASSEVKATIGDTNAANNKRKKGAGARGALAGIRTQNTKTATRSDKTDGATAGWKRAVLGVMMGLTLMSAAVPAAYADTMPLDSQPVAEQVMPANASATANSPLMLQISAMTADSLPEAVPDHVAGHAAVETVASESASSGASAAESFTPADQGQSVDAETNVLGAQAGELAPEVQQVVDQAVEKFNDKIADVLNLDAGSLASLQTPFRAGDSLTDAQQNDLQSAIGNLFKDMPAGAFSSELTAPIKAALDAGGVDTTNFDATPLGDLGDYGGDLAKNLVEKLKENNPKAFYATAGVAVAGVAVYGYSQGSEALRDIGIKPEVSTALFGGRVDVEVSADWEAKFDNAQGAVDVIVNAGGGHSVGVGAAYDGEDFSPRLSYQFDGKNLDVNLRGQLDLQNNEFEGTAKISYAQTDHFSLNAEGEVRTDGNDWVQLRAAYEIAPDQRVDFAARSVFSDSGDDFTDVGARWRLSQDNFSVSAGAGYRFAETNDGFNADLSIGYQPQDNLDIQLRGSINQQGDSSIGVGLTFRF